MSNKNSLKMYGYIMMAYGVLYALLGVMAVAGLVQGLLPGHAAGEMGIVILSFVIAILAIICGYTCLKENRSGASALGLVFAVLGLASLLYTQFTQDAFSLFDCVTMVLGVAIFYLARKK